jgi:hypothetical protein
MACSALQRRALGAAAPCARPFLPHAPPHARAAPSTGAARPADARALHALCSLLPAPGAQQHRAAARAAGVVARASQGEQPAPASSNLLASLGFAALWAGLVGYAFFLSPNQTPGARPRLPREQPPPPGRAQPSGGRPRPPAAALARGRPARRRPRPAPRPLVTAARRARTPLRAARDMLFLERLVNLKTDADVTVNSVFYGIFNIMGVYPALYACLLVPAARSENKVRGGWRGGRRVAGEAGAGAAAAAAGASSQGVAGRLAGCTAAQLCPSAWPGLPAVRAPWHLRAHPRPPIHPARPPARPPRCLPGPLWRCPLVSGPLRCCPTSSSGSRSSSRSRCRHPRRSCRAGTSCS